MRIQLLALEGFWDTGLTVTLDAFTIANNFAAAQPGGAPHFDVSIVGVRKKVRSGQGFAIPVKSVTSDLKPDWVIVPALNTSRPEQLIPALDRRDVGEAVKQLQSWYAEGARIAASCIGTFVLAEAGLLDGRDATTTWWLSPLFRQRYPNVRLDETRMLVTSDRVVTAGAAMGHLDLALWFIRQASPELAAVVSRYLLADLRSLQAPFIIPNHLAQADPLIQRFERWAREHLKQGFSLQEAASALATSARTLQRRCESVLGKSPLSYFQDLRVERAQSLLHGSGLDVDAIAAEVGYEDGATLRTLLRERLGRGVRELRANLR
ncbi:transcriptional regulator GlxA family with amidase domain [Bradyrhizobium japonicum]|jgi:transcriptional regulator GlxA family with amidase domain|uniref:GlxA family transcriptional regulator n=1 Tax=Bradyrhizobium TaxID=374 RepID=UPI0004B6FAD9|nr:MULTISPECIES: helix-turn-helix domain-containing protein [Bradyrhizobium]MBR0879755.1 helix-turn-helix domain-containing protein [Bradyrhizobium liaoningense]MBR0942419.1 helix-turn-helix domain-containing protein [Bradyrhizobium liaoningense]MBR1026464.1 helix-turn-helix domain-containing protein [Bradyrhizobium liaoningense]MBR1065650.1 helix-turn-helix domain-containing protein [Bradyrhizobium liaoningense]MCP1776888.1 transcriptional regulator GlxA family with amidase domain [Bradyrhizo